MAGLQSSGSVGYPIYPGSIRLCVPLRGLGSPQRISTFGRASASMRTWRTSRISSMRWVRNRFIIAASLSAEFWDGICGHTAGSRPNIESDFRAGFSRRQLQEPFAIWLWVVGRGAQKTGSPGICGSEELRGPFFSRYDPGLMQWFADEQGKSDVEVLIAMQHLASRVDATPYLRRITSPVLAIYPSQGPITTPEQEALLRKYVKNLKMIHIPSRHHNLHCTHPSACAVQVLHFAAQHDGISCHE